jgi:DNA-binding transcriptional regulator YiaG
MAKRSRESVTIQPNAQRKMVRQWAALRAALPEVDAQFIKETREELRCTRALFASRLFINERTLENWEQGRVQPNAQAAVLILLVRHFPDTLERLRRIATSG